MFKKKKTLKKIARKAPVIIFIFIHEWLTENL